MKQAACEPSIVQMQSHPSNAAGGRSPFPGGLTVLATVLVFSACNAAAAPGGDGACVIGEPGPATCGVGLSLFNGKDLSGWAGAAGWWTVEDGALTAQSTAEKPCKACNYLIWQGGKPADFELTCDFKLSAAANSGVQIRSETRPDWDTYGYQADMTGDGGLVGFVYHHKRGLIGARGEKVTITADGKKEVQKIGDAAELLKAYKPGEWNHYAITCIGSDITLTVNGVLMCQITDNDASTAGKNGIIALQMHPGPPMKVQFKNIILKELK
jgi:hypothetical protein